MFRCKVYDSCEFAQEVIDTFETDSMFELQNYIFSNYFAGFNCLIRNLVTDHSTVIAH